MESRGQGCTSVLLLIVALLAPISVWAKPPDWVTPEMMSMVQNDKSRCMSEHGTTEDLIDKVNGGGLINDRSITCYMFCLLEAFSIMDEDGEVEVEIMAGVMPESMQSAARETLTACASQTGTDVCDKVYHIAKCVQAKRPELWFMV